MTDDLPTDYLAGLPEAQRETLARVNGAGLAALRGYLAAGEAVAFLGAGVSAPLYPLWDGLIGQLVEAAADRLSNDEARTCRVLAAQSPEEVVEILRQRLSVAGYRETLREVLKVRISPDSGRSWTPVQELVCRCSFRGVVTTNYDSGIVDARMRVRPSATGTGFTNWTDELGMDRWRTGDAFGDAELPVLYAHGLHSQPDSVVLAATEYRRAYAGKLSAVLGSLVDTGHLVWIGFSFADQRISAILHEIRQRKGSRSEPGSSPHHVAVMPWDPAADGNDPGILAQRATIGYGALAVLYPAPGGDHAALRALLSAVTDPRFPPAAALPTRISAALTVADAGTAADTGAVAAAHAAARAAGVPVTWVHGAELAEHFTGRAEELARLDRWAADPQVALIGVTAWGGAGKTALVTHWVQQGGASRRAGLRGVFGWSFYADPSAEHWVAALLKWAAQELGSVIAAERPTAAVLGLLRTMPLLLVLDGLEVVQESPAADRFGRLLDGMLREVLTGVCRLQLPGLIVLTSRFPFADLEAYDGSTARMLDVPAFTPAEGSALLAAAGGDWLPDSARRDLVAAMDGHALAVGVLAGALAARPPADDLAVLRAELTAAARTSTRVGRVLRFYAARLSAADRNLVAAVSLFVRPVPVEAVLAVAGHDAFGGSLDGWTPAMIMAAAEHRLGGLISVHADGALSAHPLVRDSFRPLVLGAAQVAADAVLADLPKGQVRNRADAQRVVEVIELLLDADQWQAADDLSFGRTQSGRALRRLPAARLGQRAAGAFVATPARRVTCAAQLSRGRKNFYVGAVGIYAMEAGDLVTAREYLAQSVRDDREVGEDCNLSIGLQNLAICLGRLGEVSRAAEMAIEALNRAERADDSLQICNSHVCRGWLAAVGGDRAEAEAQFIAADHIEFADNGAHLISLRGTLWADWLARTGRTGPAQALTNRNRDVSELDGWNEDVARCDRMLGRLALASGDAPVAGERLAAAAECFRDGDFLVELAVTLADLAEHSRVTGDLDAADRHAAEAISIAGPRRLIPAQSAAMTARARIFADRAAATADLDHLARGRDAADAALRLATYRHLAWCELDALRAHALLDRTDGTDHRWAARADAMYSRLVSPDLDPDPPATVERQVAAEEPAARRRGRRKR
jgi:tetratricopeptide (TPR) repeat protein